MHDRLGPVRYRTAIIAPMRDFYHSVLGFTIRSETIDRAVLGSPDRDLLILDLAPTGRRVSGTTGLYHTAFLVPTHRDLARLLGRIALSRSPVDGFNHHGTHEAIYLPDPDGNGIELAWDLPEDQWPRTDGKLDFTRHEHSFDPRTALAEAQADQAPWDGIPAGTRVGHVHLHMGDYGATKDFYTKGLGMDVIVDWPDRGALFLSAGGYHHHVGNNLWKGRNLPPPPPDALGLVEYTWMVPAVELEATRIRLEDLGYPTTPRNGGFGVLDASGLGIAVAAL